MILIIESVVLCGLFMLMVFIMSRDPIKTLYNYPSKIQERVKSLPEYQDKIPTEKNKVVAKGFACVRAYCCCDKSGAKVRERVHDLS